MQLNNELLNINRELSQKGIKLRIEQRGEKLGLRGPLPSRENAEFIRNQRLSLGLSANTEGLKEATKALQLIVLQIEHKQFEWKNWSSERDQKKQDLAFNDANRTIKSFEEAFFSDPARKRSSAGTKTTWKGAYSPYFKRLLTLEANSSKKLDYESFSKTLDSYEDNSRSKQQCAIALNALAKYIDLKLPDDWKKKASGYGIHKAQYRDLPNDELIKDSWLKIPNQKWRLVFGLMATYGLRNHEVFFTDLSCFKDKKDRVIRVLPNTKTGEHQVWPFHPEWVDLFELDLLRDGRKVLPRINTDLSITTLQQVGRRVAEQFRRYQLPMKPYDLRHAWAVRTIHIGLPDTVSARMMGHSVSIHTESYHHWITKRDQQQAVDNALAK